MNKIKQIILFGIAVLMCSCQSKQMEPSAEAVSVPLGGNTYVTAGKESAKVSTDGIKSWTGTDAVLSAWFKTSQPGDLNLFLKGKAADGLTETIRHKVTANLIFSLRNRYFIVEIFDRFFR